jgi:hypothetical protein
MTAIAMRPHSLVAMNTLKIRRDLSKSSLVFFVTKGILNPHLGAI